MPVPEYLAAAPCEHGVELDMCDTLACEQEYNRLAEEHGGTNVTTEPPTEPDRQPVYEHQNEVEW